MGLRVWRTHQFGGSTLVTVGAAWAAIAAKKSRTRSMTFELYPRRARQTQRRESRPMARSTWPTIRPS